MKKLQEVIRKVTEKRLSPTGGGRGGAVVI